MENPNTLYYTEMLNLTEEQTIELLHDSQFDEPLSAPSTFLLSGKNPACGDLVKVDVLVSNDRIKEMAITSTGCVLSRISTEIWGRTIVGKSVKDILDLPEENLLKQLGEVIPMRIGCALLFYTVIKDKLTEVAELSQL